MTPRTDVVLSDAEMRRGPRIVLVARVPSVVPEYDQLSWILRHGLLDPALRERVRLRCAGITGCEY